MSIGLTLAAAEAFGPATTTTRTTSACPRRGRGDRRGGRTAGWSPGTAACPSFAGRAWQRRRWASSWAWPWAAGAWRTPAWAGGSAREPAHVQKAGGRAGGRTDVIGRGAAPSPGAASVSVLAGSPLGGRGVGVLVLARDGCDGAEHLRGHVSRERVDGSRQVCGEREREERRMRSGTQPRCRGGAERRTRLTGDVDVGRRGVDGGGRARAATAAVGGRDALARKRATLQLTPAAGFICHPRQRQHLRTTALAKTLADLASNAFEIVRLPGTGSW